MPRRSVATSGRSLPGTRIAPARAFWVWEEAPAAQTDSGCGRGVGRPDLSYIGRCDQEEGAFRV